MSQTAENGLTAKQAKRWEYSIIGLCLLAMACIFQPFSQTLFSIGCVGVVVGGLAFNLVPFCRTGQQPRKIIRVGGIVLLIFCVVVAVALASAWAYGLYLKAGL